MAVLGVIVLCGIEVAHHAFVLALQHDAGHEGSYALVGSRAQPGGQPFVVDCVVLRRGFGVCAKARLYAVQVEGQMGDQAPA